MLLTYRSARRRQRVVTSGFVVLTPMPQLKFVSWLCVFVASQ